MGCALQKYVLALLVVATTGVVCTPAQPTAAVPPEPAIADHIEGTVINALTREPIGHALVYSPDHRFATMTGDRGHFEFERPQAENKSGSTTQGGALAGVQVNWGPNALMARRPGFLAEEGQLQFFGPDVTNLTIELLPEAKIVGHVLISKSEVQQQVRVQIFRKQVEDGRAKWIPAGETLTRSDGEFRFAELQAGVYRVITHEATDRDPQDIVPGGQLYGYPPVYFPNAPDFDSAAMIQLTPGRIQDIELKLTRQPYFRVRIPVEDAPPNGMQVSVLPHGSNSPGYSLGYSRQEDTITGWLPSGSYTVRASTFNPVMDGKATITVNGAELRASSMPLAASRTIPVQVTTAFRHENDRRGVVYQGPRSNARNPLANVMLTSEDGQNSSWLDQSLEAGGALVVLHVRPGRYWVKVLPVYGYAASVSSGGVDLLRKPLVVETGVPNEPIEITLRDSQADIHGEIEGSPAANPAGNQTIADLSKPYAYVYCVPTEDSSGQFSLSTVTNDGHFQSTPLAPGVYRVLAFKNEVSDLEYTNPEAMRRFESKGVVVRVVEDQQLNLRVPLVEAAR
ncbi:hypothetical protein Acid345_2576 [Candidatus Koribacter versatilis Ellin345]|uniref:Carboxypeptidase regulatory-like domain-containing protein n=1 Tax=Koribacter versatilis (strain Ellin345) TaxID=204669 RepID=Q1INH3_KORVE|nr:hypothetical protein [Candidatus Koribacter versatilis]ABF41577.1 hypothetical protein Acid345_2576 [Candidatus Koribacter versatilis Ellin345]